MKAAPYPTKDCRADELPRVGRADVDPELERQLTGAADDEPVEVVLVLRRNGAEAQCVTTPDILLKRVRGNDPVTAITSNYLPHLGVLIVRAGAGIIRQLIAQPEVAIACANRDSDR